MIYNEFTSRIAWSLNQIPETIEEMAKKLGVNKNTIGAYKKGKGDVKGSVIVRLHDVYGYDPRWMITGQGQPKISNASGQEEPQIVEVERREPKARLRKQQKAKNNLDLDLLLTILTQVEIVIANNIGHIGLGKKAEAIVLLYDFFNRIGTDIDEEAVDEETVLRFLRLGASER
jgi:transcriptional regulator with XRE-family HTH domain